MTLENIFTSRSLITLRRRCFQVSSLPLPVIVHMLRTISVHHLTPTLSVFVRRRRHVHHRRMGRYLTQMSSAGTWSLHGAIRLLISLLNSAYNL